MFISQWRDPTVPTGGLAARLSGGGSNDECGSGSGDGRGAGGAFGGGGFVGGGTAGGAAPALATAVAAPATPGEEGDAPLATPLESLDEDAEIAVLAPSPRLPGLGGRVRVRTVLERSMRTIDPSRRVCTSFTGWPVTGSRMTRYLPGLPSPP